MFFKKEQDFQKVFGTEEGKRVLGYLYKQCGMNMAVFNYESPHITAHNSGKHIIGQYIQKMMSHDEEEMIRTIKNSKQKQ